LQNGNKTQADIAKEFSVDPATVWRVKQQGKQFKEKLAQTAGAVIQTKRIREGKFSEVDAKVFKWLRFMREKFSTTKLPVSSVMIKLQALNYARAMGLRMNLLQAMQAISRWIGIEDEPEIMAEIVEAEFESKEALFQTLVLQTRWRWRV